MKDAIFSRDKKERRRKLFQMLLIALAIVVYGVVCFLAYLYFSIVGAIAMMVLTAIGILGTEFLSSRRRLKTVSKLARDASQEAKLLRKVFISENELLLASLENNTVISDDSHHITSLEHEVYLKGRKTRVLYTLRGENVSDKPTGGIRYKIIGKTPNLKELDYFVVTASDPDYDENDTWEAKVIRKEPSYMVVGIPFLPFNRSLQPGESFCLRFSYTWTNSLVSEAGFIPIFTSNFKKGIDNYKARVEFDITPSEISFYEVNYQNSRIELTEEKTEALEENLPPPKVFTWERKSPTGTYILAFARNIDRLRDHIL